MFQKLVCSILTLCIGFLLAAPAFAQTPAPAPAQPAAQLPAKAPAKAPRKAVAKGPLLLDPNRAPRTIKVTLGAAGGKVAEESVFAGFGCTGGNKSLAVSWSAGPPGTESYALTLHDPDAPTGVGFFHWVVFDIPKGTTALPLGASAGAMPMGAIQGLTDFGGNAYGGPCPPPGPAHRYIATVYAVKAPSLGLATNTTGALLRFVLGQQAIALGRATTTYGRK
ncbi:MAG: YbhB/YbcL family Raf kinase inhibitor-like protein [Candidatus Lambdaproteobacteria bacterium]|nr:YbhB/YbcL family Raf kinase inhibitor-like protein [Candidatus Lambdaproteobacteria bacterium]